jgi:hypothetical protein
VAGATVMFSHSSLTRQVGLLRNNLARGWLYHSGEIAQMVEQRTESPRVVGSIPSLATNHNWLMLTWL